MPGRICVDVFPQMAGTDGEDFPVRGRNVVDHDIEVSLLRNLWVGPGRRDVIGRALKGDPRRGLIGRDDAEVIASVRDTLSEEERVELREQLRVSAVENHVMQTPDHEAMLCAGGCEQLHLVVVRVAQRKR